MTDTGNIREPTTNPAAPTRPTPAREPRGTHEARHPLDQRRTLRRHRGRGPRRQGRCGADRAARQGGRPHRPGAQRRHLRPGHRQGQRHRRLRLDPDHGRGRRRSEGGVRRVGHHVDHEAHAGHVQLPRAAQRSARRSSPRSSPTSTARCSPTPSARSPAGSRSSSSPAASRTCSRAATRRERLDRRRRATRCASRSAWSASSARSTSRRWSRCGSSRSRSPSGNTVVLKPTEKDPTAANWIAELLEGGGPARRRVQRRARRQGGRRRAADAPGRAARSPSSARRRSPSTSTRPATAHGKRVQALGGAKNHMVVLPDADLDLAADAAVNAGFGSAGERCMAISALVAVGDSRRSRSSPRSLSGWPRCAPVTARRGCDMGPLVTGVHRDKVASYVDAGEAAGATLVVDGRDAESSTATPTASGSGPRCSTTSPPDMSIYTDEIFGPVLVGRARRLLRGRPRARQRPARTATAPRSSPTTAALRGASRTRSRSA